MEALDMSTELNCEFELHTYAKFHREPKDEITTLMEVTEFRKTICTY
jgi:hypothetical protein